MSASISFPTVAEMRQKVHCASRALYFAWKRELAERLHRLEFHGIIEHLPQDTPKIVYLLPNMYLNAVKYQLERFLSSLGYEYRLDMNVLQEDPFCDTDSEDVEEPSRTGDHGGGDSSERRCHGSSEYSDVDDDDGINFNLYYHIRLPREEPEEHEAHETITTSVPALNEPILPETEKQEYPMTSTTAVQLADEQEEPLAENEEMDNENDEENENDESYSEEEEESDYLEE